jgi:hypothetical protein
MWPFGRPCSALERAVVDVVVEDVVDELASVVVLEEEMVEEDVLGTAVVDDEPPPPQAARRTIPPTTIVPSTMQTASLLMTNPFSALLPHTLRPLSPDPGFPEECLSTPTEPEAYLCPDRWCES